MTNEGESDSLRLSLRSLALHIRQEVDQLRASGQLKLTSESYFLRPNRSLHYSLNPSIFNDVETEHREEEVWTWQDVVAFLHDRIEPSEIYGAVRNEFTTSSPGDLLRNFCWRIAVDTLIPNSDALVDQWIDVLIHDQRQEPIEYLVRIWLTGIEPHEETITVSTNLLIRKPTLSDLLERVSERSIHYAHVLQRETHFSCIAELRKSAARIYDLQQEADRLISALRLFKLGSVSASRIEYSAQSLSPFRSGGAMFSLFNRFGTAYKLQQSDASDLDQFLRVISPSIPSEYGKVSAEAKADFLSTALDWYTDALLSAKPVQGKIASGVACLEALLLTDDPSSEVTFRLKVRAAALLGYFGWSALDVFALLTEAYNIRSIYVHGSSRKPKRGKTELTDAQLNEIFRAVTDYARLVMLILLQISVADRKRQADVIKLLTDGLIDDASRMKFSEWCNSVKFVRKSPV